MYGTLRDTMVHIMTFCDGGIWGGFVSGDRTLESRGGHEVEVERNN